MIQKLAAVWSTEVTKVKRTSALWLSLIAAALFLFLDFAEVLRRYFHPGPRPPHMVLPPLATLWNNALRGPWTIWVVVTPILIAVTAAGLSSPEHAGKHWKQLYALPIPRWSLFAAKALLCGAITAVSFLVYGAGVLAIELLSGSLFDEGMAAAIPWSLMLSVAGRAYLAAWAVIAIQIWLSMRFAGFAIPVGTGLAGVLLGSLFAQLEIPGWWPWSMPVDTLPWRGPYHVPASAVVSPLTCLLVAVLACWFLSRREVA
jgi:lantibiotic transport system permease protein